MFTGLSAFPITPFKNEQVDLVSFDRLIGNLVDANVDSICAMGSTGLYPYLTREQLFDVSRVAVNQAGKVPVMAGVGSLRTYDVLRNIETVQKAGVSAVLLAPVSYQPLNENEVYGLYEAASREVSVPICVYENPRVTNFTFSDALYRRLAGLPHIGAIKIPGMPFATNEGASRLASLREILPPSMAVGVSGDQFGAAGMAQGCDLWLSVIGGIFPKTVQTIIQYATSEQANEALALSDSLAGLWQLCANNGGGLRVVAEAAKILGYSEGNNLPAPFLPISDDDRDSLSALIQQLSLA